MRRRLLALAAFGAVMLMLAGFGIAGFARVATLNAEIAALDRDLTDLRRKAEALGQTIECLRTDPLCIEKYAREQMGMVGEGETVYKFPSERSR